MSIKVSSLVWDRAPVDGTELLALLVIADHADDYGNNSWPSIDTIARKVRRHRRVVQRALRDLEERGIITVEKQRGGDDRTPGDRRPNRYSIHLSKLDGAAQTSPRDDRDGAAQTSPRGPNGVAPTTRRGGTDVTHGAAPTPPEPSLNHPEPSGSGGWSPPPAEVKERLRQLGIVRSSDG